MTGLRLCLLRLLAPTDFPHNPTQWFEHLCFSLALEQVFLCFAPFAFFVRLLPRVKAAAVATVRGMMSVKLGRP